VIHSTTPDVLFQPSVYGVLLVVPPLICLMAAGILMLAERYYWVLGILGGMAVYLGALLVVQMTLEPEWWPMKVDFTWMLLLIALLLSAEWFLRKMLRLAVRVFVYEKAHLDCIRFRSAWRLRRDL